MQANQQPEMPASVQVLETEAKLSFLAVRCWQDAAWPVAPSTPRCDSQCLLWRNQATFL